jgi:hypothetical protein
MGQPSQTTAQYFLHDSPMIDEPSENEPQEGVPPGPAALAATEQPVAVRVALVDDERVPDGMVCMGSFLGERLIARSVLPPETWDAVREQDLFSDPVPIVLVAREAPPGLQCQLFALLALEEEEEVEDEEEDDEDESEPWAASVPGAGYEAAAGNEEEEEEDDDEAPQLVAFPLGNIVRFHRDRVHPENLPLEAADVLRKIIEGRASEVVDRALADLLGI